MLEIKDLTCGYGRPEDKQVLENINLKINEGEFCGIIGPNGSGKTTLLRVITRIINPREGGIIFEGKNISEISLKELAQQIAVVSQAKEYEYMTVEEYMLLGRIPYHKQFQFLETEEDEKIARESMEMTGVIDRKDRFITELSEGERQLVVIARAMAQKPKILMLDEPTAHLDIHHQVKILDLVKKLNKEDKLTVIIVLHDLNLASEYCDKLIMFNKGTIHSIGTPNEVLTYQNIEEVYNTVVVVKENPTSSKPYVFVVTGESKLF